MSDHETNIAKREGAEIAQSNAYFSARPTTDTNDRRNVFEAGFNRGWESAHVIIAELEAQLAAPRKQITADDVTDEMIDELARQCPTYNTVEVDRQTIAASVNIYLGTKK